MHDLKGLGSNGHNKTHCVQPDGSGFNWKVCNETEILTVSSQCYYSPQIKYCKPEFENPPHCCLKRKKSTTSLFATSANIGEKIYRFKNFKVFQQFTELWHHIGHVFMGSARGTHMNELGLH